MLGIKKLWMTSCARKITSISRFTGTTIVPVTTSSFDAGSFGSKPKAASPPAEASSSSGFVAPNFPSGPGYRKYHANGIRARWIEALCRPQRVGRQIQPHKKDRGEHGPHNFQRRVAVGIFSLGGGPA